MMPPLEERLRASVPVRDIDTQALTTAAMQRSTRRRQRQRGVFAAGCAAVLFLAASGLSKHDGSDVDPAAEAPAPSASYFSPGEGYTVRTVNGWALRVPDGWTITERQLPCGTVVVVAMEPTDAEVVLDDSCQPTSRRPSQAALLLVTTDAGDIDYPGPVTAATLPTGTSVALLDYDDDVAHAVVTAVPAGTDATTVGSLSTMAASVNVPGLDTGRSGGAEASLSARSGLEEISNAPGEPVPLVLGTDTAGLRAGAASLVADDDDGWVSLLVTLEDPPDVSPGAGRILALCQARTGALGGTCAPRGETADVVLAGTTFSCDVQLRCARTSTEGSAVGFRPLRGLFETAELEAIVSGLYPR